MHKSVKELLQYFSLYTQTHKTLRTPLFLPFQTAQVPGASKRASLRPVRAVPTRNCVPLGPQRPPTPVGPKHTMQPAAADSNVCDQRPITSLPSLCRRLQPSLRSERSCPLSNTRSWFCLGREGLGRVRSAPTWPTRWQGTTQRR